MTTEEFIKRAQKTHGDKYSYEKSVYKNANTKLIITCPKHGDFEQLPIPHINGQGCPKCAGRGLSQDEVIELFREAHGDEYDYSKVHFTRMRDKVCIICKEHGEFWQTPDKHYKLHQGCPKCGRIKLNRNRKITRDKFIDKANGVHNGKYDYSKISFKDIHEKVTIICPIHGEFEQLAYEHLNGHGCAKCAVDDTKLRLDEFIERSNVIHNFKYDYSKVKINGIKNPVEIICPIHGSFMQTPESHLKGSGCSICGKVESSAERELYEYVCKLVGKENVRHNDRTVLNGSEIDIYIPSLKIGIEYNGVIWHSEKFGKGKNYHLSKLELANKKGVELIQIFEDEYVHNKKIVLNKLKHLLQCNYNSQKINARSCTVSIIDRKEAKSFLEDNHIQGFGKSTVHIGLMCDKELVAVMSFRRIIKDSDEWELTRFASDNNFIVRGAGGKLLSFFIKNFNPSSIKSFADRRWTVKADDNLYTKLGFTLDEILDPDYRYVLKSNPERIHKFNFRKKLLNKKYGLPLTMTESEMAKEIGAFKIWDCGLFRYVWNK